MSLGEFDIIARYFAQQAARSDVLLGIGDDAAVLEVRADRKQVVAMDTIVEGVHFPVGTDAADIGYRAVAVNLSDLAAMGAEPSWMTLSLSLPQAQEAWLAGFAEGLFELAARHGVALVGGDTVKGPLVVTVQVAGWVETDRWLTRSGARAGDLVFVSGVPGEAAAGLAVIQQRLPLDASARHLTHRFLRPQPRLALGRELRSIASAAMDISDGLLTDLGKLCSVSGCGARIDVDALPRSASMQQLFTADNCVDYALAGGDDYEIMFTVPADRLDEISSLPASLPPCTQIGVIIAGSSVECRRGNRPFTVQRRGYDHFAKDERA
ncbi:MAG TPA: thiamine-phosphate kinase [Steroidobacteraceae bacterium]|jgi:thiamine-monophosphate kinase